MAHRSHVPAIVQSRVRTWFVSVYIETCRADVAAFQGIGKGILVNEGAAGDVDNAGAGPEEREGAGVQDGGAVRRGEEDAIGCFQHVV